MNIIISESGGKPKKIIIPNFLFLSPPSLAIFAYSINKKAKKAGRQKIKYSQLAKIAKATKKAKKDLGGEWIFLEADTQDGEKVKIIL